MSRIWWHVCYFSVMDTALADCNKNTLEMDWSENTLLRVGEWGWTGQWNTQVFSLKRKNGTFICMGSLPCWCHHHPACACVYNEADSSRVGIGGQSSLYAVCRAPRQKHCWAVKHSVTKTTCSWVVDRQTQAASAAPHQEFVPYHRGLWGAPFPTPVQHSPSTRCVLHLFGK